MEGAKLAAVIQDLVDRIRDAGHTLVVFDKEDVIPGELIGGMKQEASSYKLPLVNCGKKTMELIVVKFGFNNCFTT